MIVFAYGIIYIFSINLVFMIVVFAYAFRVVLK